MCLTISLNLNAKECRQSMQEGRRKVKVEATDSTSYYITLGKKSDEIAPPNTLTDSYTVKYKLS